MTPTAKLLALCAVYALIRIWAENLRHDWIGEAPGGTVTGHASQANTLLLGPNVKF